MGRENVVKKGRDLINPGNVKTITEESVAAKIIHLQKEKKNNLSTEEEVSNLKKEIKNLKKDKKKMAKQVEKNSLILEAILNSLGLDPGKIDEILANKSTNTSDKMDV